MRSDLVSVIVLTYKNYEFLYDNIQSIFMQDYNNIEIIVQDDGSPNFNYKNIQSLFDKKTNNIVNVIISSNENNYGTVKNFNNAIKKSNGNIIIPLSADDEFYDKDSISKIVKYFKENDCYIFTSKRQAIDNNGKELEVFPLEKDIKYFSNNKKLLGRLCKGNIISGASTYYKKEIFEKVGYFDESYRLLEDFPYYLNVLMKDIKIYFYDNITIKYRIGGVSTNTKTNPILQNDIKLTLEKEICSNKRYFNTYEYRQARFRYFRIKYKDYKIKCLFVNLVYFDVYAINKLEIVL